MWCRWTLWSRPSTISPTSKGQDGGCFHITDPEHYTTGQMMNIFAETAHAPKFTLRFDPKVFNFMPPGSKETCWPNCRRLNA